MSYNPTKAQIDALKAKHGDIFLIEVENKKAIVKAPGRKELGAASTLAGSDPMKFNEQILKSCWLEGDEEIKTNDRLFMSVSAKLDKIIEIAEAEIKKL